MTYMCNLKNTQMNAHANQKQTRRYGKQSGGYQRRGMEERARQVKGYKEVQSVT